MRGAEPVVSRGEGVELLEPAVQREKVIALAEGALRNCARRD